MNDGKPAESEMRWFNGSVLKLIPPKANELSVLPTGLKSWGYELAIGVAAYETNGKPTVCRSYLDKTRAPAFRFHTD